MEAVCFITQSLKNDACKEGQKTLHDILLDADITEFLCEAMATLHSHLLEYVPPINKIYVNQVSAMFLLQEDLIT
jgi:hypothetical protein